MADRRRPQTHLADRQVLAALVDAGEKLAVGAVAAAVPLSAGAVRAALARLVEAGQVQRMTQDAVPDRPAHAVYWPTPAGRAAAGSRGS